MANPRGIHSHQQFVPPDRRDRNIVQFQRTAGLNQSHCFHKDFAVIRPRT
jgi:hypothetical protein